MFYEAALNGVVNLARTQTSEAGGSIVRWDDGLGRPYVWRISRRAAGRRRPNLRAWVLLGTDSC